MSAFLVYKRKISFKKTKADSIFDENNSKSPEKLKNTVIGNVSVPIKTDYIRMYTEKNGSSSWRVFRAIKSLADLDKNENKVSEVSIIFSDGPTAMVSRLAIRLESKFFQDVKNVMGQGIHFTLEILKAECIPSGREDSQEMQQVRVGQAASSGFSFGTKVSSTGSIFGSVSTNMAGNTTTKYTSSSSGFGCAKPNVEIANSRTQKSDQTHNTTEANSLGPTFTFGTSIKQAHQSAHLKTPTFSPVSVKHKNGFVLSTPAMRLLIKDDSSATYCEGTMLCPSEWLQHWKSGSDSEFTAEINLIISFEESAPFVTESKHGYTNVYSLNKRLLQEEIQADMEIVTKNGKALKCHSAFLTAQSEVLKRMLNKENSQSKKITLKDDMSEEAIKNFLAYLYYRDVALPLADSDAAIELLYLGVRYSVLGLLDDMTIMFLEKPCTWFTADAAVRLFLLSGNTEVNPKLKSKAVQVLKTKSGEVMKCESYKKLFHADNMVSGSREKGDCGHAQQLQLVGELCNALLSSGSIVAANQSEGETTDSLSTKNKDLESASN